MFANQVELPGFFDVVVDPIVTFRAERNPESLIVQEPVRSPVPMVNFNAEIGLAFLTLFSRQPFFAENRVFSLFTQTLC